MKKVKVTLDNRKIQVEPDSTILAAAERLGVFIPTLCHNSLLVPRAACNVCAVEVEGQTELVPACSTEVTDDMVVRTTTDRVKAARRTCIELLLSDHLGDCLGPCIKACPAGIDIPGFINYIVQNETHKALDLIRYAVPFPGSLGRICDRPCEEACRRQLVEEPVAICQLKRYVFDSAGMEETEAMPVQLPSTGKRAAIVGAGPAGLTTAFFLQGLGHVCTVFDKEALPGGLLRYGIPEYRLPLSVVEREILYIKKLGVKISSNMSLGKDISLAQLRSDYDVVFLGLGAQIPLSLNVEGESGKEVVSALTFLREQGRDTGKKLRAKVIVIGGGGVAMDAARVAMRKGAKDVCIYCLEQKEEMPAKEDEIKAALDEGVIIHNGWGVNRIVSQANSLKGLELVKCLSVFDDQGMFSPQYDSLEIISESCDLLIIAAGQKTDLSCIENLTEQIDYVPLNDAVRINERTMETSLKGVFAGGDCTVGPGTVVHAVASGKKAAVSMDQFLRGKRVSGEAETYNHTMGAFEDIPRKAVSTYEKAVRIKAPELEPDKRVSGFEEVAAGFTLEEAKNEALRCIECGCRSSQECKLRSYAGLFEAESGSYEGNCREYDRDDTHPDVVYDAHKCIQCRTCVRTAEELIGSAMMKVVGRGFDERIRPADRTMLSLVDTNGLSQLVENCPTGALVFKNAAIPTAEPLFRQQEIK